MKDDNVLVWTLRIIEPRADIVIPFICQRCGNCCTKTVSTWTKSEFERKKKSIPPQEIVGSSPTYKIRQPCIFLKPGNFCSIYDQRPFGCKVFPWGEYSPKNCPGFQRTKTILVEFGKGFSCFNEKRIFPDPFTGETLKEYLIGLAPIDAYPWERMNRILRILSLDEKNLFFRLNFRRSSDE